MKELKFRNARADEIEVRVGATTDAGFSLLLYKTARVDANILDETVGAFNWQKRFYQVKNTMICEIGIYNEERKEWVWKGDAGDESNTEAIKGEASDSMKRAGFAWNICRALYTAPFIWVKKDQDNDPRKSRYVVKEIDYKDNEISRLVITNEKTGVVVFQMGNKAKAQPNPVAKNLTDDENAPIREEEKTWLLEYASKLNAEQYANFSTWLYNNFKVNGINSLTASQGIIAKARISAIKKG